MPTPLPTARDTGPDPSAADVAAALQGDQRALTRLIERHQGLLYNLSVKFLADPDAAQDATQDIWVKLITHLARFDPAKARFTTWAYRIATNHLLNLKRTPREERIHDFEQFFGVIGSVPDAESPEADESLLTEESKVACMSGMLLCLTREQRMIYLLGAVFGVDHQLGAEIFDITPDNYRKRLQRARDDIHQWMHQRCGLVNTANPCRCAKKTRGFIERGFVDPQKLRFHAQYRATIKAHSEATLQEGLREVDRLYESLYRKHPYQVPLAAEAVKELLLGNPTLRHTLRLDTE